MMILSYHCYSDFLGVFLIGNAQSIVAFVRNLLKILMGFYRTTFISHHLTRLNTLLIRVFGNVMVMLITGFQILRLFCVAYGICAERNFILQVHLI